MQHYCVSHHILYANYTYAAATAGAGHEGVTNDTVSPVHCGLVSPVISVLSGSFVPQPTTWNSTAFNNGNNHSLVIKVGFGQASFLFTGDLEQEGIQKLLNYYGGGSALDVDVLRVGHHGALNATTAPFLNAVTPKFAIISCGQWNYGQGPPVKTFTTFAYGHPRLGVLQLLADAIPGNRSEAVNIKAAAGSKQFTDVSVTKNIYATPWDGTITIEAENDGTYQIQH